MIGQYFKVVQMHITSQKLSFNVGYLLNIFMGRDLNPFNPNLENIVSVISDSFEIINTILFW